MNRDDCARAACYDFFNCVRGNVLTVTIDIGKYRFCPAHDYRTCRCDIQIYVNITNTDTTAGTNPIENTLCLMSNYMIYNHYQHIPCNILGCYADM